MNRKFLAWIAWLVAGIVTLTCLYQLVRALLAPNEPVSALVLVEELLWLILPVVFVIPGALIVSRQPRNTIGWLLMFPPLTFILPFPPPGLFAIDAPPASPSLLFLLAIWYDNWSWMVLIFPVLLIPLLFPTGRPPTPRWRWVLVMAGAMIILFLALLGLSTELSPFNYETDWRVRNPIGILPTESIFDTGFSILWTAALIILTLACVSALVVRFRHAGTVERTQIKWLLYAVVIFAVSYIFLAFYSDWEGPGQDFWNLVFILSIMAFPLAIAVAILRHRLFDIDIIIRRTLVYALLTGLLGLIYFGSIVILQFIFSALLGGQSTVAIVISTLAIAALFTPLRSRVQTFIDRRFFRQRYDAEKLLSAFARRTRDQTDLDALSEDLLGVVRDTMQPEEMSLWMNTGK